MQNMRYIRMHLLHKMSAVVLCLSLKSQGLVFFYFICGMQEEKRFLRRIIVTCESSGMVNTELLSSNPVYMYYVMLVLFMLWKWLEGRIRAQLLNHADIFLYKKIILFMLKSLYNSELWCKWLKTSTAGFESVLVFSSLPSFSKLKTVESNWGEDTSWVRCWRLHSLIY